MPSNARTTRLVIVESPSKAKTIAGYLGPDYFVEASFGHVRDLPRNAADVPAKYKGESWARLGVDVDNGFHALYVVSQDRKAQIAKLTKLAKEVDEIFLATDEDREGEAIAWHLVETIKPKVPVKRMVFHEITRPAIQAAVANPREIDRDLVDAQEARRILDRLYGYEVSPVLWKKVMPRLSAGRVQSVATRIVVERERQRMAFRTAEYWDVNALLAVQGNADGPRSFNATLIACGVISWNTMRRTGTLGFSSSRRCQAMASPSRSSSVARNSSEASLSRPLSLVMCDFLSRETT